MAIDYQASAFAVQDRLRAEIQKVGADPHLSPEGKNAKISALRETAQASLNDLRNRQTQRATDRRTELETTLFGRHVAEGNDPALSMSYRDAAHRAAELAGEVDTAKAVALMKTALRNGDVPLRKTLLESAFENQWVDVINAYAERYPSRDGELNELWDIRYPGARNHSILAGIADEGAFSLHDQPTPHYQATPTAVQQSMEALRNAASGPAPTLTPETAVDSTTGDDAA